MFDLHAILRAAASALLTAAAIAASRRYEAVYKKAMRWLGALFFAPNTRMTVEEMIVRGDWSDVNACYSSFEWYLSRKHEQGSFTLSRRERAKTTATVVLPENNVDHTLVEGGETIRYSINRTETSAGLVRRHIEIEGRSVKSLLAFAKRVDVAFAEHLADESWQMALYVHRGPAWDVAHRFKPNSKSRITDHVVLAAGVGEEIERDVDAFLSGEDDYGRLGQSWKRGYLFHGVPGTGKTSLARAIAMVHRLDVYVLNLGTVASDDELAKLIASLPSTKHMLLLEDVDSCPVATASASQATAIARPGTTLAAVLNLLDGIVAAHGRMIIMTSNNRVALDAAFMRSRRGVDRAFAIGVAGEDQLRRMFERFYPGRDVPDVSPLAGVSPATVCAAILANMKDPAAAIESLRSRGRE